MGLLSRISAEFSNSAENNVQKVKFSFFDFIQKYSLSHCCVFSKVDTFYMSSSSWGFDGETILQSISTSDFWDGTLKENKWNSFSTEENNLNSILQFFSIRLKHNFQYVQVYSANDKILLIALEKEPLEKSLLEEIANDFLSLSEDLDFFENSTIDEDFYSITISIADAANEISGNLSPSIKQVLNHSFYTEAFRIIWNLIDFPNLVHYNKNGIIHLSIKSESNITGNCLAHFLSSLLKEIFQNKTSFIKYEY